MAENDSIYFLLTFARPDPGGARDGARGCSSSDSAKSPCHAREDLGLTAEKQPASGAAAKPAVPEERYELMPIGEAFQHGFNVKTIVAALFVGFVFLPCGIYLSLVTGEGVAGGAEWVTIILFIEMAKRTFVRLRTQEIIVLYWVAGGMVASTSGFGVFIYDQYFVQSPQAIGVSEYIPLWAIPPKGSPALVERTFLHAHWIKPVLLMLCGMIFGRINSLAAGYVLFRLCNDVERLPFPMARVQAGGATALAESSGKKEGWRWRVFSIGSFIGAIWGLLLVFVPNMTRVFLTAPVQILPIPFIDFTTSIKTILPATTLGLNTNLGEVLAGFVLPFWIVVGSFVTSMISTFIGNPWLYSQGIMNSWSPGMSLIPTSICNSIDFWLSYGIGKAFVIAMLGFFYIGKIFFTRKAGNWEEGDPDAAARTKPGKERGDVPIWIPFILWAGCTLFYVVLVKILVPDFPWWISAFFGLIWSPIISYVGARMIGLTGSTQGAQFPYLREGSFYLSGYRGAAVWFAPIPLHDYAGTVNTFKHLELTRTKFGSVVYLSILTFCVMLVVSFLYWSMVWRLGPIPSTAYPYVQMMWPFNATMRSLWIKTTIPDQFLLYDFEGFDRGKREAQGLAVKDVPEHATREARSLSILPAGEGPRTLKFSRFRSNWSNYLWLQADFHSESNRDVELTVRISYESPEAGAGAFQAARTLKQGKNILAVQLTKPRPGDMFKKQLPERAVAGANIIEIAVEDFKTTDGKPIHLDAISEISLQFADPNTDLKLFLDNITLIGGPPIWIARVINWRYILSGFGVGWLLYALLTLVNAPPLLFYGCVNGTMAGVNHTLLIFAGAMIGKFYFERKLGREKWRAYAPILLAGYACGFSLVGMTSVAVVLMYTSISQVIF